MQDTEWILPAPSDVVDRLAVELGLPAAVARILVNRRIRDAETARRFLHGDLDDLYDPFLLDGMSTAVNRIRRAIEAGERILIFGDYDVDGILSVVMLVKALESLGADVVHYIPARLTEGYGLKARHVEVAKSRGASLVISVDCGIKAVDFVRDAGRAGLDVIITDHHQPGPVLPEALAVLNPVLERSGYPDRALASVGVAFKMIQALLGGTALESHVPHYLKLVAIGTVADVAALKGENRIFVKYGLKALKSVSNRGLKDLMKASGVDSERVTVGDVGFRIGPRINAAGRMGRTDQAVRLFFEEEESESRSLVGTLERLNSQRQGIEERIFRQAEGFIRDRGLHTRYKILVLGCSEWHRGVIGIVASKLKDLFYLPILLFAYEDGAAFGSGRSVQDFSLIQCLESSRRLLSNYGGHTLAVGCELPVKDMPALRASINAYADRFLTEDKLKRRIRIDARLGFDDLTDGMLDALDLLAPFGVGNPKPVFLTEEAQVIVDPRILKRKHSKLVLRHNGRVFEALGWGRREWSEGVSRGDMVNLVFSLQKSRYMGRDQLSLIIEDLRHA